MYHGWRFTADGRCVAIPALEDGAAIPERATLRRPAEVAEQDGLVWLAPEPPRAPIPDLHPGVPLGGDGIATVRLPVLRVEANAAMLIDNFLDEAHLPFVHAATIGGAGPEPIPRADVDRRGLSFTAVREHTFTNLTDPAVRDGARPAVQRRRMTYRYQAPLTATLLLEYLDAEGWQFLTFTVQPEDERTCRVYQTVTGPGLADAEQAESAAKYEMSIFDEDLELQRRALSGLEFPLDVAAELHTRADRVSVEFRRVLAAAVGGLTQALPPADDKRTTVAQPVSRRWVQEMQNPARSMARTRMKAAVSDRPGLSCEQNALALVCLSRDADRPVTCPSRCYTWA